MLRFFTVNNKNRVVIDPEAVTAIEEAGKDQTRVYAGFHTHVLDAPIDQVYGTWLDLIGATEPPAQSNAANLPAPTKKAKKKS